MAPAPRRERLFWAFTLVTGVVAALALAELALRLTRPTLVGVHHQPCIYWSDSEWGYRYRPNAVGHKHVHFEVDNEVRINSQGFHDVERAAGGADGALRVAALGDSFTASIHVPVEQTWTQVLERRLVRGLLRPVQVYNLGMDSTSTPVQLAVLERLAPELRPDVVLLGFFANDAEEAARGVVFRECYQGFVVNYQGIEQRDQLRAAVAEHAPSARARWWHEHLYLSRLFPSLYGDRTHFLLRENYVSPTRFDLPVAAPQGSELTPVFEALLQRASEWSFELVVMPLPPRGAPRASLDLLRESLPDALLARLVVVDVTDAIERALAREDLEWDDLYWRRDSHFDADGNRLFGEAAAAALAGRLAR